MAYINKFKFGVSIALPLFAGAIGSFFTMPAIDSWYKEIIRPSFNPPDWVFGPVWALLYILMGVAFYLIWQSDIEKKKKEIAIIFFVIQLALNSLWSILFFGLRNLESSLIEIFVLWLAILINLILFGRIRKSAGWLLLPYLLWVSFAAVLNFSIWQLNY